MADRFGYGEIGLDIHPCKGCGDYEPPDGCKTHGGCAKSMTNADCITATIDKLIEWYCRHRNCGTCDYGYDVDCHIREWLKSPVEVEDGESN